MLLIIIYCFDLCVRLYIYIFYLQYTCYIYPNDFKILCTLFWESLLFLRIFVISCRTLKIYTKQQHNISSKISFIPPVCGTYLSSNNRRIYQNLKALKIIHMLHKLHTLYTIHIFYTYIPYSEYILQTVRILCQYIPSHKIWSIYTASNIHSRCHRNTVDNIYNT